MKIIDVAAGILVAEGRVLVTERKNDPAFPGLWEFPGGKREPGEATDDALCRELEEELGIRASGLKRFKTLEHQYPDRHVQITFFLVQEWQGQPQGREGQALRWIPIDRLSAEELLPADAPVVAALQTLQVSKYRA